MGLAESARPYDQARFHARWAHLKDPHVRDLAWLLDAPQLFDPDAPQWLGQVAVLQAGDETATRDWLASLDQAPGVLHAELEKRPQLRLGRYAEQLMAFYFQHQGSLFAHGMQVRAGKHQTIGEFDFLLRHGDALIHWEFATKFYLLADTRAGSHGAHATDYFLGPNLADSLGAKMRKILHRQLRLACHPVAEAYLPQPVEAAQALVKGWLFYPDGVQSDCLAAGLAPTHCRGTWSPISRVNFSAQARYCILPRLSWLAPARKSREQTVDAEELRSMLELCWAVDPTPILVAELREGEDCFLEFARKFVVPDSWCEQAHTAVLPLGDS